jgi:hypothetical protein
MNEHNNILVIKVNPSCINPTKNQSGLNPSIGGSRKSSKMMMKIVSWNFRGLGSKANMESIRDLIRLEKLMIMLL